MSLVFAAQRFKTMLDGIVIGDDVTFTTSFINCEGQVIDTSLWSLDLTLSDQTGTVLHAQTSTDGNFQIPSVVTTSLVDGDYYPFTLRRTLPNNLTLVNARIEAQIETTAVKCTSCCQDCDTGYKLVYCNKDLQAGALGDGIKFRLLRTIQV